MRTGVRDIGGPSPGKLDELRASIAGLGRPELRSGAPARRLGTHASLDPWAILAQGGLHEWFGGDPEQSRSSKLGREVFWLPPLTILSACAARIVGTNPGRHAVWIGSRCWPYPPTLARQCHAVTGTQALLDRSVFIDTDTSRSARAKRVWAIELAVRCAGVGVVVADGSGLSMAESRRIQLAATGSSSSGGRSRPGTPVLIARPDSERRELSAARTRWRVCPLARSGTHTQNQSRDQGWSVELLRCKGLRLASAPASVREGTRRWTARRDHATGHITLESSARAESDGGLAARLVGGSVTPGRSVDTSHRQSSAKPA